MDLAITLLLVLMILFWPKRARPVFMLLILGLGLFFIAFVFAPVVLLSPLFYLGVAIIAVLVFYRGVK